MIRKKNLERWITLGLIVVVTILTYAPLISQLGFYRDDWYLIWAGNTQGLQKIVDLFQLDRPFMGVVYAFDYNILGDNPLNWHLYALFLKILGAVGFFWILRMLWPENRFSTTVMVLLFIVYPGFLQQPNANTFQNHLFGYATAILSIALTIRALYTDNRIGRILFSLGSVLLALVYFFIYEYMIGLEGVRIMLLGYALHKKENPHLKKLFQQTLTRWMIYLPAIGGFLFWRIFIFKSTRRATDLSAIIDGYMSSPVRNTATLILETGKDFIESSIFAWAVPPYKYISGSTARELLLSVLIATIAVGLVAVYYLWLKRNNLTNEEKNHAPTWSKFSFLIGAMSVFSTLFPITAAGRNVFFDNQFDRYTLQTTIGISLMLVGFMFLAMRKTPRLIVFLFLIGISVTTHYHNSVFHQKFWEQQRDFWWQLSWRAPDLAPDTVLVVMLPSGFRFAEAYEVWGPANLIYHPEPEPLGVFAEVLNSDTANKIIRGTDDDRMMRDSVAIVRDYKKTLLASRPNNLSCIHVIDGENIELSENEEPLVRIIASYSHIELINLNVPSKKPPPNIFGGEPPHRWCYYYQKMSLARQRGDWEGVAKISNEAFENDQKPLDRSEWIPVLEGFVNTGQQKDARSIAAIIKENKALRQVTCERLLQSPTYPGFYDYETVFEILCE